MEYGKQDYDALQREMRIIPIMVQGPLEAGLAIVDFIANRQMIAEKINSSNPTEKQREALHAMIDELNNQIKMVLSL